MTTYDSILNPFTGKLQLVPEITDVGAVWGNIVGTLSDQSDLQGALDDKLNTSDFHPGGDDASIQYRDGDSFNGFGNWNGNEFSIAGGDIRLFDNHWLYFDSQTGGINWGGGSSEIYENNDLHIYTDDTIHFDTSNGTDRIVFDPDGNMQMSPSTSIGVLNGEGSFLIGAWGGDQRTNYGEDGTEYHSSSRHTFYLDSTPMVDIQSDGSITFQNGLIFFDDSGSIHMQNNTTIGIFDNDGTVSIGGWAGSQRTEYSDAEIDHHSQSDHVFFSGATEIVRINGTGLNAIDFIRYGGTSSQFLKADGSVDSSTYITGNQTITLLGDVTGSGATSITTAIGAGKVTNTMLAGSITAAKLVGTDIVTVGTITAGTWNATAVSGIYLNLSIGVSGGRTVTGGTASGDSLTLSSTSNATKGKILFGTSAYDEVNNRLGINQTAPSSPVHLTMTGQTANASVLGFIIENTTVATVTLQQYSPITRWIGQGWSSTSSASQAAEIAAELRPQADSTNPRARLYIKGQLNGGGYEDLLYIEKHFTGGQSNVTFIARTNFSASVSATFFNQTNSASQNTIFSTILTSFSTGNHAVIARQGSSATADLMQWQNSSNTVLNAVNSNGRMILNGTTANALLHIGAGTATASTAPLKFTSGTNLTTAEAGAMEYNGTNLFFTRVGTTRESVLTGNSGAAAPTTSIGVGIVNYYGSSATNFLGDPNSWASVVIGGTTYKIPLYT